MRRDTLDQKFANRELWCAFCEIKSVMSVLSENFCKERVRGLGRLLLLSRPSRRFPMNRGHLCLLDKERKHKQGIFEKAKVILLIGVVTLFIVPCFNLLSAPLSRRGC